MGIFTDELNKIKTSVSNLLPKKSAPMEFRVGEGLTPEQKIVADQKVRQVDEFIPQKPYSFQESLALHRSNFTPNINPIFKPSVEERKQVLSALANPAMGAVSPLEVVKSGATQASKSFLKYLAKEVNPLKIKESLKSYNLAPEVADPLSRNLAGAKNVDEVKNILVNLDVTPKLPGKVGPMAVKSKIPLSGNESPKELLALAEKNAKIKHLPLLDEAKATLKTSGHDFDRAIEAGDIPVEKVYKNKSGVLQPQQVQHTVSDLSIKLDKIKPGLGDKFKQNVDLSNPTPSSLDNQAVKILEEANPQPSLKTDIRTGQPIKLTPREQQLVGTGVRAVPFMPKVNLPQKQTTSPIDTTTGEGRSREIQASQYLEEKTPPSVRPPVESSLEDIIQKEPTPVKEKVGLIDYIRTPDRVLKKIGLEEEGKLLREQHDKYIAELPKNIEKITEWSKRASKDGNEDIFRYLDGEAVDLLPQDKQVATEIQGWLKEWADRLGLPEDNRLQHYITHIFDQELIQKEFPEELAKMIDNRLPGEVYDPFLEKRLGALGYKKDTWAALDAYVKRATRKVHLDPALEKMKDASGKLEKSQYDYVKSYISSINMRPSNVDSLIDNSIKQVIGYKLGQRPTLAITRFLRQITYRAMLGLNPASALKNLSQGVNTYAVLGEKYTTIGYAKLFQKGAKEELETQGVLNGGFIEDRALSATKKIIEKFDKGLFFFFEKAEHINRGAAYFGAKSQGLAKGMSEKEAIEYAKSIVRKTQFTFGKIDTPLILSSDLAKTLGQFQSFTTKQIEFLVEMTKKAATGDEKAKNFIGLLRYAIAGTVFVYTVGQAFNMKISDLLPGYRVGTPPSLKLPYELGRAAINAPDKYGQERDLKKKAEDVGKTLWGVIPGGIQMKKTYEGYKSLKEGKSLDSAGRAQFDVGGTPAKDAQALIFGKYSGEGAQDYYENDMTYAEATLKKIMESPTGAEDFIKIIEENPTLAENVTKAFEDQALGITDKEKKIRNMGVATKQRAKEVAKIINKLDNEEEKTALVIDYIEKKIITDEVADQLVEFLK